METRFSELYTSHGAEASDEIHTIFFTQIPKPQRLLNLGNVGEESLTSGVVILSIYIPTFPHLSMNPYPQN